MDGARAPQGLDAEDRIALGLGASHLFYLVIFSMSGWALLSSPLPLIVRGPAGVVVLCAGVVLAWGRVAGRPLDRWISLYVRFRLRPRQPPALASAAPPAEAVLDHPAAPAIVPLANVPIASPSPVPSPGPTRARRVAFYSQSGGCGKTCLAFECATLVARLSGLRVAVIDLDLLSSTMRVRSGLYGPGWDDLLTAAQLDAAAMEGVLLRHPGGARVVLGPTEVPPAERAARCVTALCEHLDSQGYALVVFDIGTAALEQASGVVRSALRQVDAIYCVLNPTAGGVMGAYRAVAGLRRLGFRHQVKLVLNRHDAPVSLDEVVGDLKVDLVASVPTLAGIARAEQSHFPACMEDETVSDALFPLAEDIFPDMSARWFDRGVRRDQVGAGAGALP